MIKDEDLRSKIVFVECEIVHDSIGVTHFLPPFRCRNCVD